MKSKSVSIIWMFIKKKVPSVNIMLKNLRFPAFF